MSEKETGGPAFPQHERVGDLVSVLSDGMTLRQYAAIHLKVPDSGTDWLDEMIGKSLRDEFAVKAMTAWILTCPTLGGVKLHMNREDHAKKLCEHAYDWAGEMLKERNK